MNRFGKILAMLFAGAAWFTVVFGVTLVLTFPSDEIVERVKWQVQDSTNGSYILDLKSISPRWVGVSGSEVALFANSSSARDEDGESSLVLEADSISARVGFFNALGFAFGGKPLIVSGNLALSTGDVDFDVSLARDGTNVKPTNIQVEATNFPIEAIPEINGVKLHGTGGFTLKAELNGEEGLSKADGIMTLSARNLILSEIEGALPAGFDLGEIPIHSIDVEFDVSSGKAKVKKGVIESDMANITLTGDILLMDDVAKSRLRLKLLIDVPDDMALIQMALKEAKWADGKYHYAVNGRVSRARLRAERERSKNRKDRSNRKKRDRTGDRNSEDRDRPKVSNDARAERRKKRRDALRKRRAERDLRDDDILDDEIDARRPERLNDELDQDILDDDVEIGDDFEDEPGDEVFDNQDEG